MLTTSGIWASSPHSVAGSDSGADPALRVTSVSGSAASAASRGSSWCYRVPSGLPETSVHVKNVVILAWSCLATGWASRHWEAGD
eukprot:363333-Chlamydomonas_euryale.AAC.4